MTGDEFKDPVSHMCLAGTAVAFWSLIQEVAGLSPFTVMANIFSEFSETFTKNSNVSISRNNQREIPYCDRRKELQGLGQKIE